MKSYSFLLVPSLIVLFLLPCSEVIASGITGHLSAFLGAKFMDSDDWPENDIHFSMGVMIDCALDSWPMHIVLDVTDTGSEYEENGVKELSHTTEWSLGVRKIFRKHDSNLQPFLGGGVSFLYGEREFQGEGRTKEGESVTGIWLGGGLYYEVTSHVVLGFDVRYSHGEVTLFNEDVQAGGFSTGFTVGFQF